MTTSPRLGNQTLSLCSRLSELADIVAWARGRGTCDRVVECALAELDAPDLFTVHVGGRRRSRPSRSRHRVHLSVAHCVARGDSGEDPGGDGPAPAHQRGRAEARDWWCTCDRAGAARCARVDELRDSISASVDSVCTACRGPGVVDIYRLVDDCDRTALALRRLGLDDFVSAPGGVA